MSYYLLVIFFHTGFPISLPQPDLQTCLSRAPVEIFHLETTGRPVEHSRCVRMPLR